MTRCALALLAALVLAAPSARAQTASPEPPASSSATEAAPASSELVVVLPQHRVTPWTIQVDPLTWALGFAHVQIERALGDHASVYVGPSVRFFDPLSKESDRYLGVGGELGVRVFPWGGAPRGAWGQLRGVLARLHTDDRGGATALGGYASVLGGYTWIFQQRWVVALGLGVQYLHYRVAGLGSVGVLPAAHTTVGVAF